MGTQTDIAQKIIDKKANYVLALKANHPTLYLQIEEWFKKAQAKDFQGIDVSYNKHIEKGHHRTEIRQVWSVPVSVIENIYQPRLWAGLQSVVMVVRVRHLWNKTTNEVQFYLSSLPHDAQIQGGAIRKHWGIECRMPIGRLIVPLGKMLAEFALFTVLAIFPSYDALLSMHLTQNRLINVVFDKK